MSTVKNEVLVGLAGQAKDVQAEKVKVLVSVESPFSASNLFRFQQHIQYAVLCNKHAVSLGYATFTPHLCNTQFVLYGVQAYIGDFVGSLLLATNLLCKAKTYSIGREKTLIITNLARVQSCQKVVVYSDFGISTGMQSAIDEARRHNIEVEYTELPPDLMCHVVGKSVASTLVWAVSMAPYGITIGLAARSFFRLARRFV